MTNACSQFGPLAFGGRGPKDRWRFFYAAAAVVSLLSMAALAQPAPPIPPTNLQVSLLQVTNLAYAPAPIDNPLKGIMADLSTSLGARSSFPHSLVFADLPLSEVITGPTNFDWTALERAIAFATNDNYKGTGGSQLGVSFFMDNPNWPTSAIPVFLLTNGLQTWSYTLHGGTGTFPDYSDTNLQAALTNFIAAYGAKYDGDPRLAFLKMGTLGVWGEWHYGPPEMAIHWASTNVQSLIMDAYTNAFKKTKVLMRYPTGIDNNAGGEVDSRNDNYPVGYHDDSFMHATLPTSDATQSWFFMAEMRHAGATNKWKRYPIYGEPYNSAEGAGMFSNNICLPNPYLNYGGPIQTFSNCACMTHASFLHNYAPFYTIDLYSGGSYFYGVGGMYALQGAQKLGYELWVQSFFYWTNSGTLIGSVTMTNTGVAPFYYDWGVEVAACTNGTKIAQMWSTPCTLTAAIPGDGAYTFSWSMTNAPTKPFTVIMRAVNPMAGGKPLRFANVNEHATITNWLTLGVVR